MKEKQYRNITLIIVSILVGLLGGFGFYNANKNKSNDETDMQGFPVYTAEFDILTKLTGFGCLSTGNRSSYAGAGSGFRLCRF